MGRPFVDQATAERTKRFYAWERRGRGWDLFEAPVELEPVFRWPQIHVRPSSSVDDTRKAHWFTQLFSGRRIREQSDTEEEVLQAHAFERQEPLREFAVAVPAGLSVSPEHSVALLSSLQTLCWPLSFEVVSENGEVHLRVTCAERDEALLTSTLRSIAPAAQLEPVRPLAELWQDSPGHHVAFVEFGLGREFVLPLSINGVRDLDTLALLAAGLATLTRGAAVLQTLFVPTEAPWAQASLEAVTTPGGRPFFADAPEITRAAAEKLASPLFAVVLRLAVKAESTVAAYRVIRSVGGGLSRLAHPGGNELIPLGSGDTDALKTDLLRRTSHRTGMLLSARELAGLVRLPSAAATTALVSPALPGKAAPEHALRLTPVSVRLGVNRGPGRSVPVYLSEEERLRHVHVLGASGTGKSTLLVRLILQDIEAGRGVAVFDPHGDLVDEVLARLPEERIADTILFDPADTEAVVGWNVLSARTETERQLLASDLVAVFRRLATSWGDQMTTVLANAILAFLDAPPNDDRGGARAGMQAATQAGTLLDLRRFLVDKAFRDRIVARLRDPHLQSFWRTEFPLLVGRRPQAPILTRLDTLLRHRLVRDVVTMREGALDFRSMMDEGRILLARLSMGAIGRENAALLGSLLASRFHHTALTRQDATSAQRPPFFLYFDEFHELATPSMATLFSGVRKYGVGLTVAHHSLHQLRSAVPEVERAVLDNAHTRIVFRVGEEDARRLATGFSGFAADDITRLSTGEAIARIGGSGDDFDLQTAPLPPLAEAVALADAIASERRSRVRRASRERWATPRRVLDARARADQLPSSPDTQTQPQPSSESPSSEPPSTKSVAAAEHQAHADLPVDSSPAPSQLSTTQTSTPEEEPQIVAPTSEGRGGPEHRYLQSLIREWAHGRGYKVELEYELDDGGRVDLVLSKEKRRVAIEVSVTTSYGHEIANVKKCLAHDFERIFVVSTKLNFLKHIEKLSAQLLSKQELDRVDIVTPEVLLSWLSDEPIMQRKVAGYTVRTQRTGVDASEAEARRKRLANVIGASLRRINKDKE